MSLVLGFLRHINLRMPAFHTTEVSAIRVQILPFAFDVVLGCLYIVGDVIIFFIASPTPISHRRIKLFEGTLAGEYALRADSTPTTGSPCGLNTPI